jgi:hypothetical protein
VEALDHGGSKIFGLPCKPIMQALPQLRQGAEATH